MCAFLIVKTKTLTPSKTIAKVLGIPSEDTNALIMHTAVRSNGSSTARQAAQASNDIVDYMEKLISKKEQNLGDDLISKLIVEQVLPFLVFWFGDSPSPQLRPGHLTREDLVQISFLLLVAGNATVASIINLVCFTF